jgi:hypothetical protein
MHSERVRLVLMRIALAQVRAKGHADGWTEELEAKQICLCDGIALLRLRMRDWD